MLSEENKRTLITDIALRVGFSYPKCKVVKSVLEEMGLLHTIMTFVIDDSDYKNFINHPGILTYDDCLNEDEIYEICCVTKDGFVILNGMYDHFKRIPIEAIELYLVPLTQEHIREDLTDINRFKYWLENDIDFNNLIDIGLANKIDFTENKQPNSYSDEMNYGLEFALRMMVDDIFKLELDADKIRKEHLYYDTYYGKENVPFTLLMILDAGISDFELFGIYGNPPYEAPELIMKYCGVVSEILFAELFKLKLRNVEMISDKLKTELEKIKNNENTIERTRDIVYFYLKNYIRML